LRAVSHFEEAIRLDPGYARAHAGLAECWTLLGFAEFGLMDPAEATPRARAAAVRALELDPTLGQAHTVLGIAAMIHEWDWPRAERELKRGIELAPRSALGHAWYAIYLAARGRGDEAVRCARDAEAMEPLSITIHQVVGRCLYWARRFDEAITHLQATLEMEPENALSNAWLARTYLLVGRFADAVRLLEDVQSRMGRTDYVLSLLIHAYAMRGQHDRALALFETLPFNSPFGWFACFGLGEDERCLDAFEQAVATRSVLAFGIGMDPMYDRFRDHPRYRQVLEAIGLG
jgi:Tfp pilus assembly protein PilF